MDAALKSLFDALLSHGLPGVIIGGMSVWIWKTQQQLNQVQERRVEDAFKLAQAAQAFSSALDRNTETLKSLLMKD